MTTDGQAFHFDISRMRATFKKGSVIFGESDPRDNAYIVESGEVEIRTTRQGREVALVRLGPGEVFGETALLGEGTRSAAAVAVADTDVFIIAPALLRDRVMRLDPLVGLLMSLLVSRYRQWRYRSPDLAEEGVSVPQSAGKGEGSDSFLQDLDRRRAATLDDLRYAQEMAQAAADKAFLPYLQPIVSLPSGALRGFEALIRWQHPERGLMTPGEFLAVAERTQIVRQLDLLMLRQVCDILPKLPSPDLYVSINLSGAYFEDMMIVEQVTQALRSSGADPRRMMIEITESALMRDPATAERVLASLRGLGFRIALDDFGTGYSSLAYLHRFPIDVLKIDRSFVRDLHLQGRRSRDIVQAIITLARALGLEVIGEGVENEAEIAALSSLGCDNGQGYYFGRPMQADEALRLPA